jgi:uncharacterized protein (DUF2252 family)
MGTAMVLRELAPQDLKIEVEQFSRRRITAAAYLAFVVGVAHARQMTDEQRIDWRKQLCTRPDGDLQAPSWLWRSLVDLAATHEAGYLEHCRQYALTSRDTA